MTNQIEPVSNAAATYFIEEISMQWHEFLLAHNVYLLGDKEND